MGRLLEGEESMYEPRFYRYWIKDSDLVSFEVAVKQTDLYIRSQRNLKDKALSSVLKHRAPLEAYIRHHPLFLTTLEPYQAEAEAPAIVKEMARVSQLTGVGPMAAVAGVIAEAVGRDLLAFVPEVIVENGGDIFLKISKKRLVGIYAGQSAFTKKIALEIMPRETPLGICTSSGTVGHSLSLGSADAVIVLSSSTALADAAATALGNIVKAVDDIPHAMEKAQSIEGLRGVVIIVGDKMGIWGRVKIVPLG
jgi:ApbE superfamily uncharacterized protein (UPF0280 family)